MTRWFLAAGAAALALAAPALGEKGGQGGGPGKAAEHRASAGHGGGAGRGVLKSEAGKSNRHGVSLAQASDNGRGKARELRSEQRSAVKAARRDDSSSKVGDRSIANRLDDEDFVGDFDGRRDRGRFSDDWRKAGLVPGCPPGLDAKDNGCLPPGLANKLDIGDRLDSDYFSSALLPAEYRDFYRDTSDYYFLADQGNIYRVDRDNDLVQALIPLLGGGFSVGQSLPAGYDFYNVPTQFRSLYPDQDDYYYRYGDNAIYRVDRSTNLIDSVAALLAGDLVVGSPLPIGYDAYNVPMQYRDQYFDTPDSWYRYNDGNIYQVDPTTHLIQAVISAIV